MLGKLFKYDFKNLLRQMIPFYVVISVIAVFFAISHYLPASGFKSLILDYLFQPIMTAVICSVIFNAIIRAWIRYKQNLYGDESYLIHTLPVTKTDIFASKILSSSLIIVLSIAVSLAALLLANASGDLIVRVIDAIDSISALTGTSSVVWGITAAMLILLEIITVMCAGFFGYTVGFRFEDKKLLKGFIFGGLAWGASQAIVLGCMLGTSIFCPATMVFFTNGAVDTKIIPILMYASGIGYFISAALQYYLASKFLRSGVNVE